MADSLVRLQDQGYSACDVSDALLKLKVPGAGFIPDLTLLAPHPAAAAAAASSITVAPASTVLFVPKGGGPDSRQENAAPHTASQGLQEPNIPPGEHWADLTPPGTFVVIKQPDGQTNAVCGGIMAVRIKVRGAKGIVVAGRARDLDELRETGLPIWSRGLSTVGAGLASTAHSVQVPLQFGGGTTVHPGDIVVSDSANGVVVIPAAKLDAVLELLPRLVAADEQVKRAVGEGGMSVREAFAKYRGNL